MKKFLAAFLAVCMMLSLLVVPAIADESATGTTDTTVGYQAVTPTVDSDDYPNLADGLSDGATAYVINTVAGLKQLATLVNNGNKFTGVTVYMTADIGSETDKIENFVGIGADASKFFAGTFDGQGYTIDYLTILNNPTATQIVSGLFGLAINGTYIKNLVLGENCSVTYNNTSKTDSRGVGAVVGWAQGNVTIENVMSKAAVSHIYANAGGIVGKIVVTSDAAPSIKNCTNVGTVSTASSSSGKMVGGIVGKVEVSGSTTLTATISNCLNQGTISTENTSAESIGGIVGAATSTANIENCKNEGAITATASEMQKIGGIVGAVTSAGSILNCENTGTVSGYKYVGGILGQYAYAASATSPYQITDCVNRGTITGTSDVSGIVGLIATAYLTVSDCTNYGSVSTNSSYTGGIAGRCYGTYPTIDNCVNYGTIDAGTGTAGGIFAYALTTSGIGAYTVTVTNCTNYGTMSGKTTAIASTANADENNTVTLVDTGSADYSTTAWLLGYQVSDKYTNDDGVEVQDIRVVGIIDSLEYSAVGFEIVFKDAAGNEISANKIDQDCEYVYKQLSGIDENDTTIDYDADEIRNGGYLFAIVIKGIPTSVGDLTFEVNTYAKDVDTTAKTYGEDGTATHTVGTTPAGDMEVKKN